MSKHALVGDGLALGEDLLAASEKAVASALAPLRGERPDLVCVFVSGGSPDEVERALLHAASLTRARTAVGCGAHGVMAAGKGIEAAGGVSVWAAVLPDVSVRAFHLEVMRTSESVAVVGMPQRRDDDVVGVILADPWSFPADGFVARSDIALNHLPLVGGLAGGARQPGDTRLLVDGQVRARGAVGVVLGGDLCVHTVVSQGCRPVGHPMTVTSANGGVLRELAGRSAFEQAKLAVATLPDEEQVSALGTLAVGIAVDEYADVHHDFLVRPITAADHEAGTVTVGEVVPVGTTVQFLVRDAYAAHDDLSSVLGAFRRSIGLESVAGALVFSGSTRGRDLFDTPDHDVAAVRGLLGLENVAGCFTVGEIGPLGGRNHLHDNATTVITFGG